MFYEVAASSHQPPVAIWPDMAEAAIRSQPPQEEPSRTIVAFHDPRHPLPIAFKCWSVSGIKQHYIPRLLLRAFRLNADGKVAQVRVFRARRSYTANVDDVAAKRFFYSELPRDTDEESLDDQITRYENQLARDVQALTAQTGSVDTATAARTVAHLMARGNHVRGLVQAGAQQLATMVEELFGSDERIRAVLGVEGATPGPRFNEIFAEHVADNPLFQLLGLPQPVEIALAYMMLRESTINGMNEMTDAVADTVYKLGADGSRHAREVHNSILAKSLVPEVRLAMLGALEWRVEIISDISLILPDFVALGIGDDGRAESLIAIGRDELSGVLMPLSPNRMLVGTSDGASLPIAEFNEFAARHCLDFFVSSVMVNELDLLATTIGTGVAAGLRTALEEAAAPHRPPACLERVRISSPPAWNISTPTGFRLETNCLSQAEAEHVARIISRIVSIARQRFDVSALLRVHIPADYDQALVSLDRGAMAEAEPAPAPANTNGTVGYNIVVEEDGRRGIAMVLASWIALDLIADDDAGFGTAAGIVLAQLARIGSQAVINHAFPSSGRAGSAVDELLTPHIVEIWQRWLVERAAALADPTRQGHFREALLDDLEMLRGKLEAIRREYRVHGDIDQLLSEVVIAATELLGHAAAVVAPDGPSPAFDPAFADALDKLGHLRWLELFAADITAIWTEGTGYPDETAFLVLNRHVERLLVNGAIFLWDDAGVGRVEVPYWSDWDWIAAQAATTYGTGNADI